MPTTKTETVSFGRLLKSLRKKASLTQEALEQKTGLNRSYIAQLENDYPKTISIRTLVRLADGLGVNYDELLRSSGYIAKLKETNTFPTLEAYLKATVQLPDEAIEEASNYISYLKNEKYKK